MKMVQETKFVRQRAIRNKIGRPRNVLIRKPFRDAHNKKLPELFDAFHRRIYLENVARASSLLCNYLLTRVLRVRFQTQLEELVAQRKVASASAHSTPETVLAVPLKDEGNPAHSKQRLRRNKKIEGERRFWKGYWCKMFGCSDPRKMSKGDSPQLAQPEVVEEIEQAIKKEAEQQAQKSQIEPQDAVQEDVIEEPPRFNSEDSLAASIVCNSSSLPMVHTIMAKNPMENKIFSTSIPTKDCTKPRSDFFNNTKRTNNKSKLEQGLECPHLRGTVSCNVVGQVGVPSIFEEEGSHSALCLDNIPAAKRDTVHDVFFITCYRGAQQLVYKKLPDTVRKATNIANVRPERNTTQNYRFTLQQLCVIAESMMGIRHECPEVEISFPEDTVHRRNHMTIKFDNDMLDTFSSNEFMQQINVTLTLAKSQEKWGSGSSITTRSPSRVISAFSATVIARLLDLITVEIAKSMGFSVHKLIEGSKVFNVTLCVRTETLYLNLFRVHKILFVRLCELPWREFVNKRYVTNRASASERFSELPSPGDIAISMFMDVGTCANPALEALHPYFYGAQDNLIENSNIVHIQMYGFSNPNGTVTCIFHGRPSRAPICRLRRYLERLASVINMYPERYCERLLSIINTSKSLYTSTLGMKVETGLKNKIPV
jgi:hypothetical protein